MVSDHIWANLLGYVWWRSVISLGGPTGVMRNGSPAGWLENTGYYRFEYKGKKVLIHRFIYECLIGDIPDGFQIDHINGVRTDNSIGNLRLVTQQQNLCNMKGTGVSKDKKKFAVCRMYKGVKYRANGFITFEDAHEFSLLLAKELKGGFHRD